MSHSPGLARNQSLQRSVALLSVLAGHRDGLSATGLGEQAGLPLATTRHLLATLADGGLVEQVPGTARWVIGYELVRLGRAADPYLAVVARARAHLERLSAALGESAILGADRLPYGVDVIAQIDPPRMVGIASWVGRGFGLHASAGARLALASLGREEARALVGEAELPRYTASTIVDPALFLDDLERVREQGFAVSVDELEVGLATVAVPVGQLGSAHVFSIGISGPSFRLDEARRAAALPPLRKAASEIESALAGTERTRRYS